MREGDISKERIVNFIIEHERATEEELRSFFEKEQIEDTKKEHTKDKDKKDNRTLKSYCKSLEKEGILRKSEESGQYILNESFFTDKDIPPRELNELMQTLLHNGDFTLYMEMRRFINGLGSEEYDYTSTLSDEELEICKRAIKKPISAYNTTEDIMKQINKAIREKRQLQIRAKEKKYSLYPVCYLISRDATKIYLIGIRKNKIENFELGSIESLSYEPVKNIDTKKALQKIKKIWDKDLTESNRVLEIRLFKNAKNYTGLKKELAEYFTIHTDSTKEYDTFKGELTGINDFKHWLRRNITSCVIVKPQELREEIIKPLRDRLERYGIENE